MQLMLLGPPGAGKGTQSSLISKRYRIQEISAGNMLRAVSNMNSAIGAEIRKTIASGQLVNDAQIIDLVLTRLKDPDCARGCVLDGFPRTIRQAEALECANIFLDCVIEIDVADEEILRRMCGRLVHPASGRIYHNAFHPPKIPGIDDSTGEPLVQRADDTTETVKERLRVYREQTKPLVNYYREKSKEPGNRTLYYKLSGLGDIQEVTEKIFRLLDPFDKEQ